MIVQKKKKKDLMIALREVMKILEEFLFKCEDDLNLVSIFVQPTLCM